MRARRVDRAARIHREEPAGVDVLARRGRRRRERVRGDFDMFKDEKRTQYSPLMTREEQVRRRARRARARAIRRSRYTVALAAQRATPLAEFVPLVHELGFVPPEHSRALRELADHVPARRLSFVRGGLLAAAFTERARRVAVSRACGQKSVSSGTNASDVKVRRVAAHQRVRTVTRTRCAT